MSNPHKGELSFTVDEKTYKLSYSINSLCELEDMLGEGVAQIASLMADPSKMKLKIVRAVFWAGLLDNWPDVQVEEAGAIMSKLIEEQGANKGLELIVKGFALAFPEDKGRPLADRQRKRVGTG